MKAIKASVLQEVAAKLRRDPNTIQADVHRNIIEYMDYMDLRQVVQEGDPVAENAGATGVCAGPDACMQSQSGCRQLHEGRGAVNVVHCFAGTLRAKMV